MEKYFGIIDYGENIIELGQFNNMSDAMDEAEVYERNNKCIITSVHSKQSAATLMQKLAVAIDFQIISGKYI